MVKYNIKGLIADPDFQKKSLPERVMMLKDAGVTDADAKQLMINQDRERQTRGSELPVPVGREADMRPIVGTQQTILGPVPIRQPGTMAEQIDGAGRTQAAPPPSLKGLGPALGEIGGGIAGSFISPGVGTVLGAAAGAAVGQGVEDYILHGAVDPKKMAIESALSFLPEAGEQAVRGLARGIMRSTPGGKLIRWEEAARRAREMPEMVFDPPSRQEVDLLFDQVRQSGVKIDTGNVRSYLGALTPGKLDDLMSEIRMIDNRTRSGGRFEQLVANLSGQGQGLPIAGYDIGDLQRLRSELLKRKNDVRPFEAKQLLDDMQRQVDDAIDNGLARGRVQAGQTPQLLQQARRSYARLLSAEDLGQMIEGKITSTPDISTATFNLRSLFDDLRKNTSRQAQQINRSMDLTPGAPERYYREVQDISRLYRTIEMPLTDVAGFRRFALVGGLGQMLSTVLLSDTGRRLFRDSIITGRGRLSPNVLAAIVSAVRREAFGSGQMPFLAQPTEAANPEIPR